MQSVQTQDSGRSATASIYNESDMPLDLERPYDPAKQSDSHVPPMAQAAPTGIELETALLELLRKNNFGGAEHVSVLVVGPKPTPVYILSLGDEVAKVLEGILTTVLGRRPYHASTGWVLFRTDAEAILEAAKNAP